jgi:UDP-glucose 4-epimerase
MKIVITGVCGLIGRRLASHLLSQGHDVFGVGRIKCKDIDAQPLINYVSIDLSSRKSIDKLKEVIPVEIDLVIHCAAQQPRSNLLFRDYQKGNISTTENITEWAKDVGIQTIISFSTVAFLDFPLKDGILVTELTNALPKNYYALSKWHSESYLRLLGRDSDFSILCFRIPSLVHELQEGGLIHTFWNSAVENIDLEIYDNGKFKRNLIYIDSIIEVVDMVLDRTLNFKGFELYNIGSKDAWTLLSMAKYIYKEMNTTAKILPSSKKSPIQGYWNLDTSKAEREIGFSPWGTKKILDTYMDNMRSKLE